MAYSTAASIANAMPLLPHSLAPARQRPHKNVLGVRLYH